ncbi:hypothetical protein L3Q82_014945, partial [Scortum barcoo]
AHSEDRCMAELSIRRGSFLVSDQFINSISREVINVTQNQQIQTLTDPHNHLHPAARAHSGGCVRMRGVKCFLDYMSARKVRWAMYCSKG